MFPSKIDDRGIKNSHYYHQMKLFPIKNKGQIFFYGDEGAIRTTIYTHTMRKMNQYLAQQ
jgi:hypothetical protein